MRKYLEESAEDEGDEDHAPSSKPGGARPPPPSRPPTDEELGRRNEVRRRGGAGRGREYEARMECGFDGGSREGSEWDEYYNKELRGTKERGRSPLVYAVYAGACFLLSAVTLVFTASAMADEGETLTAAAFRLMHLA